MANLNGLYNERYRIDSARRVGHDYGQGGGYFVTICTKDRTPCFGEIVPAAGALTDAYLNGNDLAVRAWDCWQQVPQHFPFARPDAFVVMPDHVHGILFFDRPATYAGQPEARFGPQSNNLASVVRGFKVGVKAWATRQGLSFQWQAGYYDRIIRDERELEKIRDYIHGNPAKWASEQHNELSLFR
ncbi:transposase [Hymenobacter ruricola]|uniref:Transposase IS200-like domain-containing protein n=1 Tax=Hymenobacter ruricola TaxID=2791023 RepID=A0ABS0HZW9_9BACT|nr:transposase [Hymenobacter ruricola]MBF9220192.1 hypothetical protein [Hymenobacter ruricola]